MRKMLKLCSRGNVLICGLRGTGKDMLMSNIACRRHKPYISNIPYDTELYHPFNPLEFDTKNTCVNFIENNITPYKYPYSDGMDIYISDASVYFPNYQFATLNKKYEGFAQYQCLSRQIGDNNVICNCQTPNRLWDKISEQCDIFIKCRKCIYIPFLKLVIQSVRIYEKYDSFAMDMPPFPNPSIFSRIDHQSLNLMKLSYQAQHGIIKSRLLIYRNKSNYDTRRFKALLEGETK